jgi:branched-chain amino acid transport system ATP-binding protein
VLTGFYRCDRGSIRLGHTDITGQPTHRRAALGLGRTFQNLQIWRTMTVVENAATGGHALASGSRIIGGNGAGKSSTLRALSGVREGLQRSSGRVELDRRSQLAGLLSGGEQQMLAISRGLMARPICLLLDEPSLGLAPRVVESLFEVIADLATGGLTILLVEQLASVALTVADRAYVLESGRLVTDGPADEVANDPRVIQAYLGA